MLPRPRAGRRQAQPPNQEAWRETERQEAWAETEREARLWAHVLKLRADGARPGSSRRTRFFAALLWRTMQPTLGLLWAAASGRGSYRATWMYATDAETSDSLGLVEALRRGAEDILILDAGSDSAQTWFSLGEAMAAATGDERVHVALDPTVMVRQPGRDIVSLRPGQVVRPWARGTFARDPAWASATARPAVGRIWVCKPGWWPGAPWDIVAYATRHPDYPDRSPGEQLRDGAEFDAYRKLGMAAIIDVLSSGP